MIKEKKEITEMIKCMAIEFLKIQFKINLVKHLALCELEKRQNNG